MKEHEEFLEVIKLLEENYNRQLPDSILKIWYNEFKDYDMADLKRRVISCIKKYNFFPTINQVKFEEAYDTETTFYDSEIGYYKFTESGSKLIIKP